MFRIPVPYVQSELLLTPRWHGMSAPAQIGLLVLCVLVPVALVLWLYRYELRLVRPIAAFGLLTLRMLVILTLLLMVCLQPILARSTTQELHGRVLIAVDRSDSMDVSDPQRANLEKLRLARALKLRVGSDRPTAAQLDDWIKQYQEKGEQAEVQWVAPGEYREDPERRLKLAEERRNLHDQVCRQVDQVTRTQLAQKVLTGDAVQLLKAIAAKHQVEMMGFNEEVWDVKSDQVDQLFAAGAEPAKPDVALPKAQEEPGAQQKPPARTSSRKTDLNAPLSRALERAGTGGKVLGLVVLSDGQHNSGPSPVAQALKLGDKGLPIYPVALGARKAPPAVALVAVKAQAAVFKNVDLPIEARFKISNLPAQDFIAELEGAEEPLKEEIHHDGKDRYYTVRFQARMNQPGAQTLRVTVRPKTGLVFDDQGRPVAGNVRLVNNNRPVYVNVADDKARVLLVDGEARWEFHYLANALARDRTVELQSVVFAQPRLGKIPEEELKKIGNPALRLPAGEDALAGYDCIIMGDVSPTELPLPERVRLEKYVGERGGTLVMLAGKRSMPRAFTEGQIQPLVAGDPDPLLKLLPLVEPRAVDTARGFPVTLTEEGKRTSFLQMEPAPEKSLERWAELPRHYWGVIGKAKPGATALAYLPEDGAARKPQPAHPEEGGKTSAEDDPSRERGLIVTQNYGFGRVLFVGIDSTWRWRYKVGDTYHHRFWGQLIRWAASEKPLVAGNQHVRFGTRDAVYPEKQEVNVVVRLAEDVPPLGPKAVAGARILRKEEGDKEEPVALVPLTPRPAQPRVLEGRVRELPAGEYRVELAIPELADKLAGTPGPDGKPGKLQAKFTVLPSDSQEMIELATNWPLLQELADKSGGKRVFSPENAAELVSLLTQQVVTRENHTERRLWQEWGTLALFLGLLTLEWVGRKLAGLP